MKQTREVARGVVRVNGAEIYHEIRGAGPSVLLIAPAGGDGGVFDSIADLLADEFTVVTYDRRGNSRSPRPAGWEKTTMEEQADDAAWLIRTTKVAPAAVFGTSSSGMIALDLVIRHPGILRGAILHETGLFSVLANPGEVMALLQSTIQRGVETSGPGGGVEALLRLACGDTTYEALDQVVRERLRDNADVFLHIESSLFEYRPDEVSLAAVRLPVHVATGEAPFPFFSEIAEWIASRLKTKPRTLPGSHGGYIDHPQATADALRPLLRQMTVKQ